MFTYNPRTKAGRLPRSELLGIPSTTTCFIKANFYATFISCTNNAMSREPAQPICGDAIASPKALNIFESLMVNVCVESILTIGAKPYGNL